MSELSIELLWHILAIGIYGAIGWKFHEISEKIKNNKISDIND